MKYLWIDLKENVQSIDGEIIKLYWKNFKGTGR